MYEHVGFAATRRDKTERFACKNKLRYFLAPLTKCSTPGLETISSNAFRFMKFYKDEILSTENECCEGLLSDKYCNPSTRSYHDASIEFQDDVYPLFN